MYKLFKLTEYGRVRSSLGFKFIILGNAIGGKALPSYEAIEIKEDNELVWSFYKGKYDFEEFKNGNYEFLGAYDYVERALQKAGITT